jgi:hypothetical protein
MKQAHLKSNFIKNKIIILFKEWFIYKLQDIIKYIIKNIDGEIDKKNIYLVLNDLIGKDISGPFCIHCELINVNNELFLAKPHTFPDRIKSEKQLIDLLYSYGYKNIKTQLKIINKETVKENLIKDISPKNSPRKNVDISQNKIYGSFLNKQNRNDNIFRIIVNENNNVNEKNIVDKRKKVSGKICSLYYKEQLNDISKSLGMSVKKYKNKTLDCEAIYNKLRDLNLIVE